MLGVGTAASVSQLLVLAVSPLLTRLYDEEAFGQFGGFFAFSNILAALFLFGLNDAVLAAKQPERARALSAAGLWTCALLSVPVSLMSWMLITFGWFGLGNLPKWTALLILPEFIFLTLLSHFQIMLIRGKKFRGISASYLSLGGFRAGGQVGGGLLSYGYFGMAGGEVLGRFAAIAIMGAYLKEELVRIRVVSMREMASAVYAFRNFPLFRTPSTVASAVSMGAPPLIILSFYGPADAGYFNLMFTIVMGPITLIQKAVGDVFVGHFAEHFHTDRKAAERLFRNFFFGLVPVAASAGLVLYFFGPFLFGVIFGENWVTSGEMAGRAGCWVGLMLLVFPLSQVINIANRPELKFVYDLAYLIVIAAGYFLASQNELSAVEFVGLLNWLISGVLLIYLPLIVYAYRNPRELQGI